MIVGKVLPVRDMKAYTGSTGIAPFIPKLGHFTIGKKNSGIHGIGSNVGPRTSLEVFWRRKYFLVRSGYKKKYDPPGVFRPVTNSWHPRV